jgi:hypothetical protein
MAFRECHTSHTCVDLIYVILNSKTGRTPGFMVFPVESIYVLFWFVFYDKPLTGVYSLVKYRV